MNKAVSAEEQGGAAEVVPPLPPHWTQHRDETSGYDYFYNDVTGTTQWERPVADAPAPAPAPPPPTPPPTPAPTAEPAAEPTADDRELMEWARQNPDATEVRREGKQITDVGAQPQAVPGARRLVPQLDRDWPPRHAGGLHMWYSVRGEEQGGDS